MTLKKLVEAYRAVFTYYLDPAFEKYTQDVICKSADLQADDLWRALYTIHSAGLISQEVWNKFFDKCRGWEMLKFLNGEIEV